jgi:hypothetical protein
MNRIVIIKKWMRDLFSLKSVKVIPTLKDAAFILIGSAILAPIAYHLPLLGWDWYYFFNANNPDYNLYSLRSAYPPFAHYIIELFTWAPWRISLAALITISLLSIAIATWRNGGKYLDIILALTTPAIWFLFWVGHPDGLVLLGLVTGFIPLILLKPVLSIFAILENKKIFSWTIAILILSILIWPEWILNFQKATVGHEADIGWAQSGLNLWIIGILLLVGSNRNRYQLMAAGCFITPYLMPYHMAILAPAVGTISSKKKILFWLASWSVFIGTGSSGTLRMLSYIYPITIYILSFREKTYFQCLNDNKARVRVISKEIRLFIKG